MVTDRELARILHAASAAAQEVMGDDVISLPWVWEPQSLRELTLNGVARVRGCLAAGSTDAEVARCNHGQWVLEKAAQGWRHGPEKDAEQRRHPCLVPWEELGEEEKRKALMFVSIVRAWTLPIT